MRLCRTVVGALFGLSLMVGSAWAQQAAPVALQTSNSGDAPSAASAIPRFAIHGVVRSGGMKLPGVSVTAAHSLTGRKVISSTDVDGYFHLGLPFKGRWVLRTEFSAFAVQTAELVLTPERADAVHDFELVLLSRVPKANNAESDSENGSGWQRAEGSPAAAGRGAQMLTLSTDNDAPAQSASSSEGDVSLANVSGLAASADATNQSVSVSGRMGNAQDFGLQNMDELRDRVNEMHARGQLGAGGFDSGGGPGGGGFGLGGFGSGGGGRMRLGSLNRPHGQIYYTAGNAALDAAPYALTGTAEKPSYSSNKIGATLGGPLKIPHIYDGGGKTFFFLNYSGIRSSTPYDVFSHVPTEDERAGDFSRTLVNGSAVQLYDPAHPGTLLGGNGSSVPSYSISPQAAALMNYIPLPNVLNNPLKNYHFSSAADANQDTFALRLTHNFAGPIEQRIRGEGGGGRPRNNLSFGLNYQRNESDSFEPFPTVYGVAHTNGFNDNVGWAISKGKLSNQLRFTWNRSRSHTGSHFAGVTDMATGTGINYPAPVVPAQDPAIWGLPGLTFTDYTSLSISRRPSLIHRRSL